MKALEYLRRSDADAGTPSITDIAVLDQSQALLDDALSNLGLRPLSDLNAAEREVAALVLLATPLLSMTRNIDAVEAHGRVQYFLAKLDAAAR